MSNWIDWQGGECPVAADAVVQFRERNGCIGRGVAGSLPWLRRNRFDDIVSYRLAPRLPTFADLAEKAPEAVKMLSKIDAAIKGEA